MDPKKKAAILIAVMELLESSSSDDEHELEALLVAEFLNKKKIVHRYKSDDMDEYSDEQFKEHFRVDRATAQYLIEGFSDSQFYPTGTIHTGGSLPSSVTNHVLSFLWFAGNKCGINEVAKKFGLGGATCFRQITRVINYLVDIAPQMIRFPKTAEKKEAVANEFKKISGFPGVIGCIDTTLITTRTPAHKNRSSYTHNRLDAATIRLQGICDHTGKFIDIFTGPSGKNTDSKVYHLSFISKELPKMDKQYHVLGDNHFQLRDYFLTPYEDIGVLTEDQQNYNEKFLETRQMIERNFKVLKNRFRQLMHLEFHKVEKIAKFILSCCVLHNICVDHGDFIEIDPELYDEFFFEFEEVDVDNNLTARQLGEDKRNLVCRMLSP